MGATVLENRFGAIKINITPANVSSLTSSAQSFTCAGLLTTCEILRVRPPSIQTGLSVQGVCQTQGNITLVFTNVTATSLTPAAGDYVVSWFLPDGGAKTGIYGL